jgi:hypothetical protein
MSTYPLLIAYIADFNRHQRIFGHPQIKSLLDQSGIDQLVEKINMATFSVMDHPEVCSGEIDWASIQQGWAASRELEMYVADTEYNMPELIKLTHAPVMEKLVVVYYVSDECTYCYENVVAIEAESVEAFYVNFEAWVQQCIDDAVKNDSYPHGTYQVGSYEFEVENFRYVEEKPSHDKSKGRKWNINMPEVYTLDEWFEKNKVMVDSCTQ